MRCPALEELPDPQPGKTGWPWTEETRQLPDRMPDGSPWPRITIVTPSFNQGRFLEETIRSVLLQGYPDLEYRIIDGGSSDDSVKIIQKYGKFLSFWASEPDRGQSHAINKGFSKATGKLFGFLNSDDVYEPGALRTVAHCFSSSGTIKPLLVAGECAFFENQSVTKIEKPSWPEKPIDFLQGSPLLQPATFWSRDLFTSLGGFDETLDFCFDGEFFLRIKVHGTAPSLVPHRLARFREHPESKSRSQQKLFFEESVALTRKHGTALGLSEAQKRVQIRDLDKRRRYIQVFLSWQRHGRFAAIVEFLFMLLWHPSLVIQRRILGLARRLLLVRYKNVIEFREIFKLPKCT
jgi:glycosyltransferase involved in cell wall biosynthesis